MYIASNTLPMLAALNRVGPGLWYLDEFEGPKNTEADSNAKGLLIAALRTAGLRLARQNPARALSVLCGGFVHRCEDGIDDEPRTPEAELDESLVA